MADAALVTSGSQRARLAAVTAHGLERAAADGLDQLARGVQLPDQAAGRAHRRLDGLADLARVERTPLDARDHQLAHREADGARRGAGAKQPRQLRRDRLLEPAHCVLPDRLDAQGVARRVHPHRPAVAELAGDDQPRDRRLHVALDDALERTRAEDGIVADARQVGARRRR